MQNTNFCDNYTCGSNGGIEPQRFMTNTNPEDNKEEIADLTLLLIALTSWQENIHGEDITQSWKGYDFRILDELNEKGYIVGSKRSKLVILTDEGLKKSKELIEKYLK